MVKERSVSAKYICLDIVDYTKERAVEYQLEIRSILDRIVRQSVLAHNVREDADNLMYLPTGDGMCIALLDAHTSFETQLAIALNIIKGVAEHKSRAEEKELEFGVRIGLNAHTDNIVTDINGDANIAGVGINTAFRIMGLADGQQILVSLSVFANLENLKGYRQAFVPFDAVVRHGVPVRVYQYTGQGEGLDRQVPGDIKDYYEITGPTSACGLKSIYESRDEKVAEELVAEIGKARKRVLLLGIGLFNQIKIADSRLLRQLSTKYEEGVEVKILLLDGLRSPAVFRTLLESSREDFLKIIKTRRRPLGKQPPVDPYFQQDLFINFRNAWEALMKWPNLQPSVRLYGHIPNCWLAIVDDVAYFQPYTFGDADAAATEQSSIQRMPVFKFHREANAFSTLETHFRKLWLTSDASLFHTGANIIAKEVVLWNVFRKRLKWFENAYGAMYNGRTPGADRRTYPRQPCASVHLAATVKWKKDGEQVDGEIINFTNEGILLKVERTLEATRFERTDEDLKIIVRLDMHPRSDRPTAIYLVEGLLIPNNHAFHVVWGKADEKKETTLIALQALSKSQPPTITYSI